MGKIAPEIEDLRKLLAEARRAVVFTGAGISTESGIADFRSPGGIWSKVQPVDYRDFIASEDHRREYWRQKFAAHDAISRARPNRGHRAVAALIGRGCASSVITQNIDGLHQASGIAEDQVIELHGNTTYASCLDCAKRFALEPIMAAFGSDESLPLCDGCGGLVKTATISFGQAMPEAEMRRAEHEALSCDLFLAIGSSLVVQPAAGLPLIAKREGACLVILNREPTDLDPLADLVLHHEIGPTLGAAVGVE